MNYKIIILIFIFIFTLFLPKVSMEGFETYTGCIEEGYPMDFCTQTPVKTANGSGFCSCANGYFGSYHMGEGKCYCYLFTPPTQEQPYESSPF